MKTLLLTSLFSLGFALSPVAFANDNNAAAPAAADTCACGKTAADCACGKEGGHACADASCPHHKDAKKKEAKAKKKS